VRSGSATIGDVADDAVQQHRIEFPGAKRQRISVGGDPLGPLHFRRRLTQHPERNIDAMHPPSERSGGGGLGTRTAADLQQPRRVVRRAHGLQPAQRDRGAKLKIASVEIRSAIDIAPAR
jgi:hypothetical protein